MCSVLKALQAVGALAIFAAAIATTGCSGDGGGSSVGGVELRFDGDKAYQVLGELVAIGPRISGSFFSKKMLRRIQSELEAAGAKVETQEFERQVLDSDEVVTLTNVIGRFQPEKTDRVVLVTHHDTRREAERDPDPAKQQLAILGANDGGSGTAILMALIPLLAEQLPEVGVDLIFFDGEEWGKPGRSEYCQGSRHFIKSLRDFYPEKNPRWVICLDMVGDKDLQIPVEWNSQRSSPALTTAIVRAARKIGCEAFTTELGPNIEDDHTVFLQAGIPAALLIDYEYKSPDGKTEYYHTHEDTLDKCSAESLQQIGRVVEYMIYHSKL